MELNLAWRNVAETGDRSVHCFLHCIRREIQNREAVQEFWNNEAAQTVTDAYRRSRFAPSHGSRSTVSALAIKTRSPSSQGPQPRNCFFCDETGHFAKACTKVPTLAERRKILIKKGRCEICMRANHNTKNCDSPTPTCRQCNKGNHHQALCPELTEESHQPPRSLKTRDEESHLCKTASVVITTPQRKYEGLLVDGGSNRTFIKRQVAEALDLEVVGEEELLVAVFGQGRSGRPQRMRRRKLQLSSWMDRTVGITIEALEINTICLLVPAPLTSLGTHLLREGFQLADRRIAQVTDQEAEVDILIGNDHYWDVMARGVYPESGRLRAVSSILGCMIQGPAKDYWSSRRGPHSINLLTRARMQTDVVFDLSTFWSLEGMGIREEVLRIVSK